jgi:hypothetical protein
MKLEELKQMAINKRNELINKKNLAYGAGEIDQFYALEQEIAEVDLIIEKLES